MAGQAGIGHIGEAEFERLLEVLSSTSKGRAFLDEYRRRFRPDETLGLLHTMKRIESTVGAARDQLQPERLADELRSIAMFLDMATEGMELDPEGDEPARRFALAARARKELLTLATSLSGNAEPVSRSAIHGGDAEPTGYTLRDPVWER
jgi:hypothetical protein